MNAAVLQLAFGGHQTNVRIVARTAVEMTMAFGQRSSGGTVDVGVQHNTFLRTMHLQHGRDS